MMRVLDLVSVALCIGIVGASFSLWHSDGTGVMVARIQAGASAAAPATLDDRRVLTIDGPLGITQVELDRGRARFVSSPCRDQHCVLTGWISRPGSTIVCLPNQVSLDLVGTPNGYDAITF